MTKKEGMCNVDQTLVTCTSTPFEGLGGGPLGNLLYIVHPVKQSVPADSTKALTVWIT